MCVRAFGWLWLWRPRARARALPPQVAHAQLNGIDSIVAPPPVRCGGQPGGTDS